MIKRFLIFFVIIIFGSNIMAQGFFVFDVSGNAYIKSDKTQKQIERKDILISSQTLIVKDNTSVILFRQADGVPVNIKLAGSYNFINLIELADAAKPNVTSYFMEYCKNEIIKGHDKEINKGKGVVSRGRAEENLLLLPPDSSLIIVPSILFCWQKSSEPKDEYFIITDTANNEILKLSLSDTCINIFPLSCGMKQGRSYLWMVSNKKNNFNEEIKYTFKISSDTKISEIKSDYNELNKSLKFDEKNNMIFLAQFYEKNHLYNEAYSFYQSAIKKFPQSQLLIENFELFKQKISL